MGVGLGVQDVFEAPSVAGLAARAVGAEAVVLPPVVAVVPRPGVGAVDECAAADVVYQSV